MMHRFMAAMLMCLVWPAAVSAGQAASPGIDEVFKKLESLSAKVESQQRLLNAQAEQIQLLKKQLAIQAQATAKAEIKADKAVEAGSRIPTAKEVLGDKFSLSTDLRLRYEGIGDRQSGNKELADRHRFRIRWRVFGGYQVTDELSLHSMLTTSSGSWYDNGKDSRNWQPGRTSNQSMDNEFNNKDVFVGRIYATYKPKWASGLELTGGKFKNTFLHTDIMWDPDVNPEGFYQRYQYNGWKRVQPFAHVGQMVVAENNKTADSYLLIWQGGARFKLPRDVRLTLAGSYYDWQNLNKSAMSKVEGSSAGNSVGSDGLYLYGYQLAQGLAFLDLKLGGLPVGLWFDYIRNLAGGVPEQNDSAFSTGLTLGKAKKKGDWQFYFKYAQIEPDAVVGAVTDGDFYGTNRVGYKAQIRYQLYDPWQLRLSWFQTDALRGPENSENRVQLDMIFKFNL